MSRAATIRTIRLAAIAIAAALSVWFITTATPRMIASAVFFAVMLALAEFLRIEVRDHTVRFDLPISLGAIVIFHDPKFIAASVLAAVVLSEGARAVWMRRLELRAVAWGAELALTYAVVALLYTSAVPADAAVAAKVSGYLLLLIGYFLGDLLLVSLRRSFAGESAPIDFRRALATQGLTFIALSPMVAVVVMLYRAYGLVGVAAGFLPVLAVASAMRNAVAASRLNDELSRRSRELSILTESSAQVLSADDDYERLRHLTILLSQLARMKACAVVTWEVSPDVPGAVFRFGDCAPGEGEIGAWVEAAGFAQSSPSRPFVLQDELRRFPLSHGDAIQVIIGIQTPEIIYGTLIFETDDPAILKSGSLNLLTLLVNQAALAMQDQLLRRETNKKTLLLESQASTNATILEVANGLIGYFDIDGALTRIAHAIRKTLGFEVVVFGLYDVARDEYVRRAHAGLDEIWEEVRKKRVPAQEIEELFNAQFRIGNAYFVSHAALRQSEHDFFVVSDERPPERGPWHENDMLIVPLLRGDQKLGYLSIRQPLDARMPGPEQFQTLEIFTAQAVTALQSARQYEEIRRLTFIDSLTLAYNHRFFQEALAKEIHRHSRSGNEFALAMLDIDNFKRVNDSYGHPVGDEILKGLVDELLRNARDTDVVARYGGEEFAIIFPETPSLSARDAANRFRELVEKRYYAIPQLGRELSVTISIGVAIYPRDGITSADLIARADEALYYAKKHGKNQVALAADVLGASQFELARILIMPARSTWAG